MAIALREVIASFGIEVDKTNELGKADKKIDGFADKLLGFGKYVAGAFAVTEVVSWGKAILADADALAKQAGALGVSTAALQGWQHAAQLSGSSADEFGAAFTKFTRNVAEAGDAATGPAADAFRTLGISVKDATGKLGQPIDLLDGVVAGLEKVEDPAKRTQVVMDLFGKSGAKLLPLFSEGKEGIAKLRAEVGELGASFDEAFLKNAQEFNDNFDRMKLGLRGLAIQVIGPMLPGLVRLSEQIVAGTKAFIGWVKGTTLVRAGLTALSLKGVSSLLTAIPQLIARFGGLSAILRRAWLFALRFLAPVLLLDDALGFLAGDDSAIGAALDKVFGEGTQEKVRQLIGQLVDFFKLFQTAPDDVRKSFATLPQDLEKDLGSFGSFLGGWGQSIVDVGLFAVNALTGGWNNFFTKAKAAGDGFMLALKIIWTEVKFAGLAVAASLSDAFDNVWNGIISGAQAALNALLDVLAKLPGTADAVKELRKKVSSLDSSKGAADAGATISKERDTARLDLAAEYDRIGNVATAPALGPATSTTTNTKIEAPTTVHVTVAPGTPAEVARGVGKAVKDAGAVNLRGMKNALVPTPR